MYNFGVIIYIILINIIKLIKKRRVEIAKYIEINNTQNIWDLKVLYII